MLVPVEVACALSQALHLEIRQREFSHEQVTSAEQALTQLPGVDQWWLPRSCPGWDEGLGVRG